MNVKQTILLAVMLLVMGMTAWGCAVGEGPAGGQPVVATDVPSPSPPPTEDQPATQAAESTANALATNDAEATGEAQALAATVSQKTQLALDKASTATQAAGFKLTATADFFQIATAQAQGMISEVQKLFESGMIGSTEGEYYRVDDFDKSWAQLNYYDWWQTGLSGENFVMSGDAYVSSASTNANWFASACGICFSLLDGSNHDVIWIAMDGRAYLMSVHKDVKRMLVVQKWGAPTKTDFQAHYMVVVNDKHVTLYIDNQEVFSVYDGLLGPGLIANTLVSGTNKGYGTRCKVTDVDLWIIK